MGFHGMKYKGPSSYWEAHRYLGNKDQANVPGIRSTYVHRINADTIALRFHCTDVVTWSSNGDTRLRTNGWHTPSTIRRLIAASPHDISIWNSDGELFIRDTHGNTFFFEDNCILKSDGHLEGCTHIVVQRWNEMLGTDYETPEEVKTSLARLNFRNTRYAWNKMRGHRRFIAANCRVDFLPTLVSNEEVADVVAERLRRE